MRKTVPIRTRNHLTRTCHPLTILADFSHFTKKKKLQALLKTKNNKEEKKRKMILKKNCDNGENMYFCFNNIDLFIATNYLYNNFYF